MRGWPLSVRVGSYIPGRALRAIGGIVERFAPNNNTVLSRWAHAPDLSDAAEVCIFVSYAPGGVVPEYTRLHARAWVEAGFQLVLVLNTDAFEKHIQADDLDFASAVLVRENRGYDFGA